MHRLRSKDGGRAPVTAVRLSGAFAIATGDVAPWNPWWFGIAERFLADGSTLFAVGGFTHIAGYPRSGIAIFDP